MKKLTMLAMSLIIIMMITCGITASASNYIPDYDPHDWFYQFMSPQEVEEFLRKQEEAREQTNEDEQTEKHEDEQTEHEEQHEENPPEILFIEDIGDMTNEDFQKGILMSLTMIIAGIGVTSGLLIAGIWAKTFKP